MIGPVTLGRKSLDSCKALDWMNVLSLQSSPGLMYDEQINYADTTLKQTFDHRIEGNSSNYGLGTNSSHKTGL